MRTFEDQIAGAVRNLLIACLVLGVALVVALGLASWGLIAAGQARRDLVQQQRELVQQQKRLTKSVQSPTHSHDIAVWCNAINASRDYQRQYSTGTLHQSEAEAQTIEQAIASPRAHGLTKKQASFIRLYLNSVVALEREVPQTLSLHPFTLGDLDCKTIEAGEAASAKTSR